MAEKAHQSAGNCIDLPRYCDFKNRYRDTRESESVALCTQLIETEKPLNDEVAFLLTDSIN